MPAAAQNNLKKSNAAARNSCSSGVAGSANSASPATAKKRNQHHHQQQQQQTKQSSLAASSASCQSAASAVNGGDGCFSGRQLKKLKDAFDFFDIDNDGRICCAELQKVLRFLGTKVNEEEVKAMIADVDTNQNGTVEFSEFLRMMRSYHHRHCGGHSEDAEMWEAFKAFDHNGDNYIDFTEIKKTMQFLGEEVTDADVKSMIKEADVDNDGRINFEEFKKMLSLLHQRADRAS